MATDFRVLQTYDELGEACEQAVITALTDGPEWEPPPTKEEQEWAEGIARKARQTFLMGLDAADPEEM